MSRRDDPPPMQRLPADVERPDTILFGLTGRQVIILGGTGVLLWAIWTCGVLPAGLFLAFAAPMAAAGFFLAVGRRDGVSLDRWLLAALTHRRSPHQLVPAEAPIQAAPRWVAASGAGTGRDLPAVLRLPARGITADGLVDLGPDGTAALVACSTVNFHLRSGLEQRGLVGGYARWLNSLDSPVQILIRSRRVDLTGDGRAGRVGCGRVARSGSGGRGPRPRRVSARAGHHPGVAAPRGVRGRPRHPQPGAHRPPRRRSGSWSRRM